MRNMNTTTVETKTAPVSVEAAPPAPSAAETAETRQGVPTDPNPYNRVELDAFWPLYARSGQPAIERACRGFSRAMTDNAMSVEDMAAWVDDRVMKMVRQGKWPVFHDHPTPAQAAERIVEKARLLARWAYIALSRQTFRRKAREAKHMKEMGRTELLASVSRTDAGMEQLEEVNNSLDKLRASISAKTRLQVAASWPEADERRRVALELGVTDEDADAMLDRVDDGAMKANTLDQMRSRSRREIRGILGSSGGSALTIVVMLIGVLAVVFGSVAPAVAGEQTGGRPGGKPSMNAAGKIVSVESAFRGEQTGGRPG